LSTAIIPPMATSGRRRPALPAALTTLERSLDHVHYSGILAARTGVDLPRNLHPALATVAEFEPVRVTDLARILALELPTVSRYASRMEQLSLVRRYVDPSDRRATLLAVTSKGGRLLDALYSTWEEILAERFTSAELSRVTSAVSELASALAEVEVT
jgi:DNA-binding MarR family transcriptional regulator